MTQQHDHLEQFQQNISYRFRDVVLLRKALTHWSRSPEGHLSHERLEFLGDAVASLVVAQELYESRADLTEGDMTVMKSDAVSRRSMAAAGRRLDLHGYLKLEPGLAQKPDYPPSVISNAYEAVIGAVFLDGGLEPAREFIMRTLAPELKAANERTSPPNCKAILQQLVQADGHGPPVYRTVKRTGPQQDRSFMVAVDVQGVERGSGWGKSKKDAEQEAARCVLEELYPGWDEQGRPRERDES